MLTTIEGIYENGQVILKEKPVLRQSVKVFVTFTEEVAIEKNEDNKRPSASLRGAWKNVNDTQKKEIEGYFDNIRSEWERDI